MLTGQTSPGAASLGDSSHKGTVTTVAVWKRQAVGLAVLQFIPDSVCQESLRPAAAGSGAEHRLEPGLRVSSSHTTRSKSYTHTHTHIHVCVCGRKKKQRGHSALDWEGEDQVGFI